jgi:hypothetical protein
MDLKSIRFIYHFGNISVVKRMSDETDVKSKILYNVHQMVMLNTNSLFIVISSDKLTDEEKKQYIHNLYMVQDGLKELFKMIMGLGKYKEE